MEQEHPLVFGDPQRAVNATGAPTYAEPATLTSGEYERDGMKRQTDAVRKILAALEPLPPEGRMRVIRAAAALFGVALP